MPPPLPSLRYVQRWDEDLITSHTAGRMLKLIVVLAVFVHLNACLQFGVPRYLDFPEDSWTSCAPLWRSPIPRPADHPASHLPHRMHSRL